MARVSFTVVRELPVPAAEVFGALVDWRDHATWVPMTRVVIEAGDGGPGTVFVATTGLGPLALPDRMRVDALDPDAMTVRITKIGPVLSGVVDLSVTAVGPDRSRISWVEDIRVPYLPQFLAPPVTAATRRGFESSITRLATRLQAARR